MTPEAAITEIQSLTADLISTGLCIDQNFPSLRRDGILADVTFGNTDNLSVTLRNIPYAEAYMALIENRSFNMKLIDGGLIQLLYRYNSDELTRHRLAFFPSPDLLEYQNNSEYAYPLSTGFPRTTQTFATFA
ncbi:DUF2290 domain-containing protein [Pseudomonas sp.]|uniref:DUF2290 domain-containing protein n=1 Tax=Pseudomonas sp. TaxID=306 RepID=UPI0026281998|nr:DUF2290 domain-containing protein [Pseudomonas sp.]